MSWYNDKLDGDLLSRIRPTLESLERLGAEEVWLFGSQALGPKQDRDVDFLVDRARWSARAARGGASPMAEN